MVQDGIETAYAYDALGQLIRVDDGQENATWLYTYDNGGNIRSKQKFALGVTTGEPLESKHFSYSNAAWRDQLTAVDGVAITYDAIGTPLSDGTWSYTWQNGRQLQKMQKQGETVEFVYNENGLRVQKTATSTGVTKYTLHGKNVVHMTRASDELHFFYDAQNRPAVGVYNGVPYAYVKSLQGDVIAILDAVGNVVVSYAYDAWGAPIGKSGALAETLGTVQPFRYRGYVYDEETGMYYLQIRFYSPVLSRFLTNDGEQTLCVDYECITDRNLKNYCGNNPVNRKDEGGDFWALIGAAVGAIISAGFKLADQLISGTKIEDVDWKDVGIAAASGAITGFVASTPLGLGGQVLVNAVVSTAGYIVDEATTENGEITAEGIFESAAVGAVSGFIGGRGTDMRGLRSLWKTAGKGLAREARRKNTQYAARQIAKYACQRTSVLKDIGVTFTRYVAGALLAPKAPTVVDKFVEAIE